MNKENKFVSFCGSTLKIIFFIIVCFLTILSIFNTSCISISYDEYTFYIKDNVIRNLILVAVFILAICIISKTKFFKSLNKKIEENEKAFKAIKNSLLLLIFIFCCIWIFTAHLYPEADQYSVQATVAQLLKHDFSSLEPGGYLYRYPFQSGIICLSYLFALVFGPQNYMGLEIINALSVVIIYNELSNIGEYIGLSKIERLFIILSIFIFPVPIFYTYFIYGTFIGLALVLISIRYLFVYFNKRDTKSIIISICAITFAMIAKSNYIIFLIALLIISIIDYIEVKNKKSLLLIFLLIVSYLFQNSVPRMIIEKATNTTLDNGLSYYSDIAMGLQESERAPGWYNGYNNDSFVSANSDAKLQAIIAKENIKERIRIFANDGSYTFEFFTKKIASQWNNPTFQVFWNLDGKISEERTRSSWAMNFIEKRPVYTIQKVLNVSQTLILFGSLLYLFSLKKTNNQYKNLVFGLIIIGGFIFHAIWEAKAQYMINYFILLIPYSASGYRNFIINIQKKDYCPSIVLLIITIAISSLFIFNKIDFLNVDNQTYYNYIYDIEEY